MLHVVDVELTPNPHAIKFVLNQKLLHFTSRQFSTPEDAVNDPLANGIFALEGVASVFYTDKFITVEKKQGYDWGKIQRPFLTYLSKFDQSLIPEEATPEGIDENTSELLKQISEVLNKKVVPALAYDGGGLEILGLELFAEMGLHFLHPLSHEALGSNDQHPLYKPTQLQFTKDQTGFDGFAQANFVS